MSPLRLRPAIVRRLVGRDFHLERRAIAVSCAGAIAAAVLACQAAPAPRSIGMSLLAMVTIGLAFHIPLMLIFGDRERGTLALALSLPVTPAEHALARLAACMLLFFLPLSAGSAAILAGAARAGGHAPWVASHAIPGAVLALLVLFSLVLAVALSSESQGLTMGFLAALLFLAGNAPLYVEAILPGTAVFVGRYLEGRVVFFGTLGAEIVLLAAIAAATAGIAARKRSYV
ncbi:MAG: hypothetical protein U0166_22810 [Acidobacteriota bacterium]